MKDKINSATVSRDRVIKRRGLLRRRAPSGVAKAPPSAKRHSQCVTEGSVAVHRWSTNRAFGCMGAFAFLALAVCVFAWGLQYKLSLYDPPQAASHQVPRAKLLSKDEQLRTESPLVIRSKTFTRVIYAVPAAVWFIVLLALSVLNSKASGQRERRTNWSWHLRLNLLQNSLFVRPPPVLA